VTTTSFARGWFGMKSPNGVSRKLVFENVSMNSIIFLFYLGQILTVILLIETMIVGQNISWAMACVV